MMELEMNNQIKNEFVCKDLIADTSSSSSPNSSKLSTSTSSLESSQNTRMLSPLPTSIKQQPNSPNHTKQDQSHKQQHSSVHEDSRSVSPLSASSSDQSPAGSPFHLPSNCSSPDPSNEKSYTQPQTTTKKHSKKLSKPKKYLQDISLESVKSPTNSIHSPQSDYISPNRSRSNTPSNAPSTKSANFGTHQQDLSGKQTPPTPNQFFQQMMNNSANRSSILNIETIINKMSSNMNQFNPHSYNYPGGGQQFLGNNSQHQSHQQSNKYHSNLRLVAAAAAAANPLNQFAGFNAQPTNHIQHQNPLLHHPFPMPPHAYFANMAKYAAAMSGNPAKKMKHSELEDAEEDQEFQDDYNDRPVEETDDLNSNVNPYEDTNALNDTNAHESEKFGDENNDTSSALGLETPNEEYSTMSNHGDIKQESRSNNQSISSSGSSSMSGLVCVVCGDISSGKHYGILACNGCSGFFKRSVRRKLIYRCQAGTGSCIIDKAHRNQCQACRLKKCLQTGMNKDAVQNERQPRNTAQVKPDSLIAYIKDGATVSVMHSGKDAGCNNGDYVSAQMSQKNNFNMQHGTFEEEAYNAYETENNKRKGNMYGNKISPGNKFGKSNQIAQKGQRIKRKAGELVNEDEELLKMNRPNENSRGNPGLPTGQFNQNYGFFESNYNNNKSLLNSRLIHQQQPNIQNSFSSNSSSSSSSSISSTSSSNSSLQAPSVSSYMGSLLQQQQQGPNETVQEASARLLFMSIKWCKSLPSFTSLPLRDQIILLEESWSEIFLLCALQWSQTMEVNPLLSASDCSPDKANLRLISELIQKFKILNPDGSEFAFLKAIVLFKSETRGLKEPHLIETFQDQAQMMLAQHLSINNSNRFGKLLLILPMLKNIGSQRIEKLYFTQTIGNLSIEKLLTDLIKN